MREKGLRARSRAAACGLVAGSTGPWASPPGFKSSLSAPRGTLCLSSLSFPFGKGDQTSPQSCEDSLSENWLTLGSTHKCSLPLWTRINAFTYDSSHVKFVTFLTRRCFCFFQSCVRFVTKLRGRDRVLISPLPPLMQFPPLSPSLAGEGHFKNIYSY